MRKIIVLNHIYKNAGTTVASILRANFGAGFSDYRALNKEGIANSQDLAAYLARSPVIRAVEIHHFACGLFRGEGLDVSNIIFLRDPLSRVRSIYDFARRCPKTQVLGRLACALDFRLFLEKLLDEGMNFNARNPQTRILANDALSARHARESAALADALSIVREVEVLGIVERFDESLVVAEERLRNSFPGLDVAYAKKNVTPLDGRAVKSDDRGALEEALGLPLVQRFREANAADYELVKAARTELEQRFGQVVEFTQKLRRLRERSRVAGNDGSWQSSPRSCGGSGTNTVLQAPQGNRTE